MSERYPFGKGETEPLYLTNACCEHAHGDEALMEEFGLGWSSFPDGGDFYPLNDAEAKFIADDEIVLGDDFRALMGYSVLYKGEKFYMPTIEIMIDDTVSETDAELAGKSFGAQVSDRLADIGGHLLPEWGNERYNVRILIPVSHAETFDGYEAWTRYLQDDLLKYESAPEPKI